MSFEQVKSYLAGLGLKALEFDVSSATVELAAVAVGCEPRRIAKTMSFLVDDAPVLIVLAGDAKVNNTKFKAAFHQKAKMLGHEQVAELTGFPVGGVCPFLAPEGVKVYLDQSLRRFPSVFPACGSANSAIELTIPELETYSRFDQWVDVCKVPDEEQ